jgi:UDP-N-acetylglucosamine--N-acetylmuramyl-(pentapeptide) pyrophosphoryl-undecaprenol N-acetylglucosamine transferase
MSGAFGILIAGGGTGGHVFPALALAAELSRRRPEEPVVFVGTRAGLESDLVPKAGYPLEFVRARGIVGKGLSARLAGTAALAPALLDSWRILSRRSPRAVVGVGGYASGPVVATAWLRRVPTIVHEANAVPGVTNRLLSRVATRVAAGTPAAAEALPGAVVTGNPVRDAFFRIPSLAGRPAARRMRVLVVGGSQGAQILNRLLPDALAAVAAGGRALEIVHQAGRAHRGLGHDADDLRARYEALGFGASTVREFLDDMPSDVAAADLVVARSGAMTTAEMAAAGRPALFVPFAGATHGHQEANARALERAGAAVVVTEAEATVPRLSETIAALLADSGRLLEMGEAARRAAVPDAAARLADLVLGAAGRPA